MIFKQNLSDNATRLKNDPDIMRAITLLREVSNKQTETMELHSRTTTEFQQVDNLKWLTAMKVRPAKERKRGR